MIYIGPKIEFFKGIPDSTWARRRHLAAFFAPEVFDSNDATPNASADPSLPTVATAGAGTGSRARRSARRTRKNRKN